jgi:hypothetical protein
VTALERIHVGKSERSTDGRRAEITGDQVLLAASPQRRDRIECRVVSLLGVLSPSGLGMRRIEVIQTYLEPISIAGLRLRRRMLWAEFWTPLL